MEPEDLTTDEIFFLNMCNDNPSFRYTGTIRTAINTLCSYGLVDSLGNLQYEVTDRGREMLQLLQTQQGEEAENVIHELVGELSEAATSVSA